MQIWDWCAVDYNLAATNTDQSGSDSSCNAGLKPNKR